MSASSYTRCVAEKLGSSGFSLASLFECAEENWAYLELVVSAMPEWEPERVKAGVSEISRAARAGAFERACGEECLRLAPVLVEAFLGAVGVAEVTSAALERLEELQRALAERGVLSEGRLALWSSITRELRLRIERGALRAAGSAAPLLLVSQEDLPWALGYLWPAFVEQVRGRGFDSIVEEVAALVEAGRCVELAGPPGSGKMGAAYLSLLELSERGFALYAGDVGFAERLYGEKVVFSPRRPVLSPAGSRGECATVNVGGRVTREELEEIARRVAEWDGARFSESELREVIDRSNGMPGFVEAVSAYFALSKGSSSSPVVPGTLEELERRLREAVPPEVRGKLAVLALLATRCFPTGMLDVEWEGVDKLLLRHDGLGLYSWRSTVSKSAFRAPALQPQSAFEHVLGSESPFHAAWSLVSGSPGLALQIAVSSLSSPGEESFQALEAVAILAPGTVSKLLGDATTYRLRTLASAAISYGSLATAEELTSAAYSVLRALGGELREAEEDAVASLAELRLSRGLPELALEALSGVSPEGGWAKFRVEKTRGVALLRLGRLQEAEEHLRLALGLAEELGLKVEWYSVRLALAEVMWRSGRAEEARSEVDRIVAELVAADCSFAGVLFDAAQVQRELKGKVNYAVCAALTRCGYPDLAGSYGCFTQP